MFISKPMYMYVQIFIACIINYTHVHVPYTCRPLHLAIIHENTNLTQYLVKLIVGVYMNLDIANNMRQVQYAFFSPLPSWLAY